MYKVIVIDRRTYINLRNVALIEPITENDLQGMIKRYGGAEGDYKAFRSAVRLIDKSTKLATQSIRDLIRRAKRKIALRPKADI